MDDNFEQFMNGELSEETEAVLAKSPAKKEEDDEGQLTLDIYQTDDDIIIRSTVAGVDPKKNPEDLDISITNDMVTIKGRRELEEKVLTKDYFYQELYWGKFSRSVILPVEIDPDGANATLKNGILTITMPKKEKKKTKKLKIS